MKLDYTGYKPVTGDDKLKRLLIDVINILPGYPGCGDFSRVSRVMSECKRELGDNMPLTADQKIVLGLPMACNSIADSKVG